MKVILCGPKYLEAALPDVAYTDGVYIPSVYNYQFEKSGRHYVYNLLTRRLAEISSEENHLLSIDKVDVQKPATSEIVSLIQKRFLVHEESVEHQSYVELYSLMGLFEGGKSSGYRMYDILPTTGCNARCFYCFEAGVQAINMTLETADQVVEFIKKTHERNAKIEISWFGGEPLCRTKIIDYISEKLHETGIEFYSTMITNGYLWSDELIGKARELWKLDKVQITLDGMGEEHNRRKAYASGAQDSFDRTISNIKKLLSAGMAVAVRINIDKNNVDSAWQLIDYLKSIFSNTERISIGPAILAEKWFDWSDERSVEQQRAIRREWTLMRDNTEAAGYMRYRGLTPSLQRSHCMANSATSITIQPDGKLYACQTGNDSMLYGNIWDGITAPDILAQWSCNTEVRDMCKACKWLPQCTAFKMCPALPSDCACEAEDIFIRKLHKTLKEHQL